MKHFLVYRLPLILLVSAIGVGLAFNNHINKHQVIHSTPVFEFTTK